MPDRDFSIAKWKDRKMKKQRDVSTGMIQLLYAFKKNFLMLGSWQAYSLDIAAIFEQPVEIQII